MRTGVRRHYGDRVNPLSCTDAGITDGSMAQNNTQSSLYQDDASGQLMDYRGGTGSQ